MKPESPHPRRPTANHGHEGQGEYIQRLEERLQEIWTLVARRRIADVLTDPESVVADLKCFATEGLGFSASFAFLDGEAIPESAELAERAIREERSIIAAPRAVVPMICGETVVGAVMVEDARPEGLTPWSLALLDAAARESASTLMRIRTRRERQAAQARIEAMSRLEESILASTRLDDVLARGVRVAVETLEAAWGAAWVCDSDKDHLRVIATFGTSSAALESEAAERLAALAEHAKRAMRGRGVLHRKGGTAVGPDAAPAVAVPVIAFGEVLGAIALAGRVGSRARGFGPEDEPFLRLFAAHAALAIQNASILARQREAEKRLKDVEGQLVQTARLAALGEMSAKFAHEIRNPLSAIGGFARRIMKALPEEDPNRSYADVIARETARLESILSEHLDFARVRPPRLANIDLNATVHETIELIRPECESAGVKLFEAYESRIPSMLLDPGRVKQVLLNILRNARQSTRQGERIRVRTRSADGWAQIEIANDGEKVPGEILEQLFVPFATAKRGGSGLGLAVADQIVKDHGGEIRVRSDPEWSVVFTVSFPLRSNQERRRGSDRRSRDRRRVA